MNEDAHVARTVTVSYPADLSEWGRESVDETPFRRYLQKVHETASIGDVWDEFVGVGCCGDTLDVPLRVEAVETSETAGREDADESEHRTYTIDEETTFIFEERAECDVRGGWEVQSHAGP